MQNYLNVLSRPLLCFLEATVKLACCTSAQLNLSRQFSSLAVNGEMKGCLYFVLITLRMYFSFPISTLSHSIAVFFFFSININIYIAHLFTTEAAPLVDSELKRPRPHFLILCSG